MLTVKTIETTDVKWEFKASGKGYCITKTTIDFNDSVYYFDELTAEGVWWDIVFEIQLKNQRKVA
jgi:hypothetical protein